MTDRVTGRISEKLRETKTIAHLLNCEGLRLVDHRRWFWEDVPQNGWSGIITLDNRDGLTPDTMNPVEVI